MSKTPAYAELVRSKDPTSTMRWYRIYFDLDHPQSVPLQGPFRDATDAESAAYEEAKHRNLDLEWLPDV